MAKDTLIRHGTEAGYRTEITRDDVCERCRNAHRVFDKQYTKRYKEQGIKYDRFTVLDHLYVPGKTSPKSATVKRNPGTASGDTGPDLAEYTVSVGGSSGVPGDSSGPSLADRLAERMRTALGGSQGDSDFVPDDAPDYIHPIDPDPEPDDSQWEPLPNEEFILNAAGMAKIEDSLGTYLSIIGMTVEMIDPYCGPIIAQNMGNVVTSWAKVIGHYPSAAKIFLDTKGGVFMLWISALQSTWPILYALYEHHLAKTVQQDNNGNLMRMTAPPNPANGHAGMYDNLTPDFNYTTQ